MAAVEAHAGRSLVFLIGFMGAGKTTVGELLARELGWGFEDTDRLVEQVAGRAIDRIFESWGEGRFRALEAGVLSELVRRERCVVATGGGVFLGRAQRSLMKARGRTVWLDLPLEVARSRVGKGQERPLWTPDDPLLQRSLFEKRRATYALAHLRVDAAEASAATLASGIARFFR